MHYHFKHTLKEVHQSFLVGLLFIDVDFLFIYFVVVSLSYLVLLFKLNADAFSNAGLQIFNAHFLCDDM